MRISLYVMSSRKLQAFFIGLISLIGLIGLIGPISPISLIAPSGLRLACPKPPKKCPFDTRITSKPHFFEKKSLNLLPFRKKVVPLHSLSETDAY
jgi:hypothetical protein